MSKKLLPILTILLIIVGLSACSKSKKPEEGKIPKVGLIKFNPHPATLEGKTVLMRWNGKYNGDNLLNRIAELLNDQVKGVQIIKMWELDRSTAIISDSLEKSEKTAAEIAKKKPDLVIAAQAD
ncbi:MAG TPA: hypothetical protein VLZ10_20440 [Thermodesulfobacteriota bacterium]|nr:hypothetical protein [Thermodesulfobacteriota bacterium]